MTVLQALSFIVGLYLIAEAIHASAQMVVGDSVCRMVKYLFVGYVGSSLIMYHSTWDKLIYAVTICLFLLPKFEGRFKCWREHSLYKRRATDE